MSSLKVSVIVPVYNTEKYLKECLDSLVGQTLEDIQIVIVDDGSTDSSPDIIADYKARYPKKITAIRQENGGQGKARNVAFGYCEGEYIGFLDSDDYAKPEMFERMYSKAKETDADCVACGYTSFTEENGQIIILEPYHASPERKNPKDMFLGMFASSCLHLIKKSTVKQNEIRYTEGVIFEDTAFFAKLIPYITGIEHIHEAFVYRRMRANSTVTTVSLGRILQMLTVMEDINTFFEKRQLREFYDLKECFCVRILLCSHLERVCLIESKKERKSAVNEFFEFIRKNYPNYRKNPHFKTGKKNFYIRHSSPFVAGLVCELMRIKKRVGTQYT